MGEARHGSALAGVAGDQGGKERGGVVKVSMGRPIGRWTLHELLKGAEHFCRDISEHFLRGYVPAVKEVLAALAAQRTSTSQRADLIIVHAIEQVEEAERYGRKLMDQLDEILRAIQDHAEQ